MMQLSLYSKASEATKRFVRLYVQREAQLGESTFIHPVTARSAHLLDFEFGGPIQVQSSASGLTRPAQGAALVGLQTFQRNQLLIQGNVESFIIFLQPAAIHRLFRLPPGDIVNRDDAAQLMLGKAVSVLYQKLGDASSFQERVKISEQFILSYSLPSLVPNGIELSANEIMRRHGGCRTDWLAQQAGLSLRNFQRMFREQIGVSPKLYSRIVRFESALKTKASAPHRSWTNVAHDFGYHDQMHMIHDFQQLSGETPTGILGQLETVFEPQIRSAERDPDLLVL